MFRLGVSLIAVVAGACGVTIEGGAGSQDANKTGPPLDDAAIDAPIDARPCTGGDARMMSPSGACFLLFTGPATYAVASAACTAQGAHLAVAPTAQDAQTLTALVGPTGVAFIGFTDQAVEGSFVWVDGTPRQYTNWYTGEPNDGSGNYPEDCAVVAGIRNGQWDDRPCAPVAGVGGGSYAYLCQL